MTRDLLRSTGTARLDQYANHPREIKDAARCCELARLEFHSAIRLLLRDVNDDAETMRRLVHGLRIRAALLSVSADP